ncbi:MAG: TIGR02679 family protein [Mycobacteriales bacterium]|nr:TIGR02679 family protein [Mycobacteriales bacterium]
MTLPDWLADPALLPVWQRLRAPLERGTRTTRLTALDRATRHALSGVLGRPLVGDVPLMLADVSALLESRAGLTLEQVVVAATGPLRDRAAEQAAREVPLSLLAAVDLAWAEDVRRSGLLTRLPDAEAVACQAVAVRALLPASPARLRTELAVAVTGDAHALDEGRALAAVVLRGLAGGAVPATAAQRRKLWEESGVLADTVSTSVLTLGLRPVASGPREQALRDAADRGDPVHLTPWDLRRVDVALGTGRVLVVENPSVLESFAARHGGRFAVVCTAGWPAAVALDLIDRLAVPLDYHGDFDWRGVEICSWLIERRGVQPWRMSTVDYLAAPGGGSLTGREVATPWDPGLAIAMHERGVAVHEEQVFEVLLAEWRDA